MHTPEVTLYLWESQADKDPVNQKKRMKIKDVPAVGGGATANRAAKTKKQNK